MLLIFYEKMSLFIQNDLQILLGIFIVSITLTELEYNLVQMTKTKPNYTK